MSKCEHGQKITTFCASECCVWKQAGGCPSCIKKYHNHMGPTIFVTEDQAQQIIKKFNVDTSTKPKCRSLQQAIFNYFNLIKTQFIAFVDNACMDIINQIGHPYLTETDLLTTYKRIKKKDYKKIQQKQFKHFYQISQAIVESQLIQKQRKNYIQKVKEKSQFINSLEKIIRSIQRMCNEHQKSYLPAHDGSICLKINQITKNILKGKNQTQTTFFNQTTQLSQSQKFEGKTLKYDFNLTSKLQKVQSYPIPDDYQDVYSTQKSQGTNESNKLKDTLKDSGRDSNKQTQKTQYKSQKDKQFQKQKQKQSAASFKKKQQKLLIKQQTKQQNDKKKEFRLNSLDRHFTKTNNLQKKKELQKILNDISIGKKPSDNQFNFQRKKAQKPQQQIKTKQKEKQKDKQKQKEKQKQKQQISPKRRAFETKQLQINEKKQKLIDMMRQKQQSSPVRQTKPPQLQLPTLIKNDNKSENKLSQNDSDSQMDVRKDLSLFAHTILPISQDKQKLFQDTQQVTQKTIIIPVQNKMSKAQTQQCVSPLLKSRMKFRDSQKFAQKNDIMKISKIKQSKQSPTNISPKRKQKQQTIDLTQKQQKSIALLIKSLNVKAQQAVIYLQSSLQYAQDNLSASQYLTYLYLQLDKPKQCLTVCNKILQKLSHSTMSSQLSWHININKSAALNKLGRYSQSIVILQQTLKYKQCGKIYKNLGDSYFSIGIFQKSSYYYQKAVAVQDNYDQAHYNLAVCQFLQENYHNAKFSVAKALVYNPNNVNYLELQKQINMRIKDI